MPLHTAGAKNAGEDEHTPRPFVFELDEGLLESFSRNMRAAAKRFTKLGALSLYFVVVQICLILFGLPNIPDSATIGFLSFCTLAVGVCITSLAFQWARLLFEVANEAKAAAIRKAELNIVRRALIASNQLPGSGNTTGYIISDDLYRTVYTIWHVNSGAFMFAIASVIHLVSFYCFIIQTQPVVVWVPALVLVITAAVWLWVNELQRDPYQL